jgi:hypothetical protein
MKVKMYLAFQPVGLEFQGHLKKTIYPTILSLVITYDSF